MVKVAGIWEQGWNTPWLEFDLWEYPLHDFGVDEFYMTPISGIAKGFSFLKEKTDIQEVLNENPDLTVVWIDERGTTKLKDFVHPENALYITGKTTSRPMVTFGQPNHLSVQIETKPDGSTQGGLWSHQAITLVLYDRIKKSNGDISNG
jgi:hypothetical protein